MPVKQKRVYKKKRVYKRKSKRSSKTINYRGGTLIAPRFITRLKYCETWQASLTGGILNDYQFRLNSLFDPTYSLGGHQPLGYDQYTALYARYRVFACSYKITLLPNNANGGAICMVPTNSTTPFTDIDDVREQPRSRYTPWSIDQPRVLSGRISIPQLGGVTSVQYKSDDRFQAATTANPTEVYNLHVALLTAGTATMTVSIEMVYHAEFFDPHQVARS